MIFLKKRITLIFILTLLLTAVCSEAAEIKSVLLTDFDNSVLTVSGEAEEKSVTITIVPDGTTLSAGQIGGTEQSNISIQYADVTDKEFSVSFNFPAGSGDYDVYVSGNPTPVDFEFISKDLVLEFVDDLGDQEIAETEIFGKLKYFSSSMGVDVSFATDTTSQDALAKNMIYYAADIKTGGIEKIKAIAEQTKAELEFLSKLSATQTATGVYQQLSTYHTSAQIDMTAYNNLTSEYDKTSVCTLYIGKSGIDIHTFRTNFAYDIQTAANTPDPEEPSVDVNSGYTPSRTPISNPIPQPVAPSGVRLFDKFNDVEDVSWAWDAILYLSDNGIINGVGDNNFAPNSNIKREQIAKIITIAFNKNETGISSGFDDIENDGWSEEYIASAKKHGIMTGISDTSFGYGKEVTREDLCVTIYRAAKLAGKTFNLQKSDFSDYGEISEYAKEAVSYLAGSGIISGMGDGTFAPKRFATRAEAAKILYAVIGGTK